MSFLRSLTVRQQLIATFVLVTVGFVAGTGIGDRISGRMHASAVELYDRALVPVDAIGDVMRSVHDARGQLLLGLQHDPKGEWAALHDHRLDRHLGAYQDAVDEARDAHAAYARRQGLPDDERRMLAEAGAALDRFAAAGGAAAKAFEGGDFHAANLVILKQVNPALAEVDSHTRGLELALIKRAREQNVENGELRTRLTLLMWIGAALGVAMVWGNYVFLSRNIHKPLQRLKEVVSQVARGDLTAAIVAEGRGEFDSVLGSVAHMQAGLRQLLAEIQEVSRVVSGHARVLSQQIDETARRSQSQSERIVEVTTALEQISRSIEEVSSSAGGVDDASREARDFAERGAASMDESLGTVTKVVETVRGSSCAIQELCDSARHISELAGIIKDIAGQTNLLALNAAIEAARAGEQGLGFAVVANEVRKLAELTATSSTSIGELLESVNRRSDQAIVAMGQIMGDVEAGAEQSRAMGDTLRQILDAAREVSDLTHGIAAATQEQSAASTQTVGSMDAIARLTESNNAAIQEVAVAAAEMNDVAGRLSGLAGRFRLAA